MKIAKPLSKTLQREIRKSPSFYVIFQLVIGGLEASNSGVSKYKITELTVSIVFCAFSAHAGLSPAHKWDSTSRCHTARLPKTTD